MHRSKQASGFVTSDGYKIYWQAAGEGQPLMLVHGWGSDLASNWVDTGWVAALTPHRRVFMIDVRGHGRSDKPLALEPYSYAAMSRDVLHTMDALDIPQCDFMGYSMGAFMGAYLLGHHPDRFTSFVLGGIGDETEDSAAQGAVIAAALREPDATTLGRSGARQVRAFVESNPLNALEPLAYSAQKMWPEGYPLKVGGPNVARAANPVLIVNGSKDFPYVSSADAVAATLANARHVQIPECDHLSTVTDARFEEVVIAFLTANN